MCRVQRFPGPPAERTSLRRAGVAGLISARAGRDGVALSEGTTGRQVTWADLADHLRSWRAVVSSGDIRPGSRVGLRFADPLEMAPSYLAAVAAGLTVAPLDPQGALVELIAAAGHLGLSALISNTR
jgi:acyl-CoA synthetase (AMP-forming)/AMP-acid ligase II